MPARTSPATTGFFLLLLGLAVASLLLAVLLGSVPLHAQEIVAVFQGQGTPLARTLVLELRLPRGLAAFATGASLAVAGTLMQILLRNPLADPYVLGISGGAAVGTLVAMSAGFGLTWTTGAGFLGALLSTLLVFGLAHWGGHWSPTRLLLTGVVMAAGWGAIITLLLALRPSTELPGMLYWLMGDLSQVRSVSLPWIGLLLVLVIMLPLGRSLNVLAQGSLQAAALGVNVLRLEGLIYGVAALITSLAVVTAGTVGFVGLIIPHLLRLVIGNDQRILLPAAALAGGTLLTLADTLARTLLAPEQLPVGVITAFIGVPIFLFLLHRQPH